MLIKRFFYFQDILMKLIIKGGERMRKQLILTAVFILSISWAQGISDGRTASLDIVGSNVNNTTFISLDGVPVALDVIGSTTSNIQVGALAKDLQSQCRYCYECGACGEPKIYTTPWDDFTAQRTGCAGAVAGGGTVEAALSAVARVRRL